MTVKVNSEIYMGSLAAGTAFVPENVEAESMDDSPCLTRHCVVVIILSWDNQDGMYICASNLKEIFSF